MRSPADTKIPPAGHQAGKTATVEERRKKRLVGPLLILIFLALPSLVFAECPRVLGAPGIGWLHEFPNNLAAEIGDALAARVITEMSFISLLVLVGMVVNRGNARENIQPERRPRP